MSFFVASLFALCLFITSNFGARLLFDEEFNTLNKSRWSTCWPWGDKFHSEDQYICKSSNIYVSNGVLHLQNTRENYQGYNLTYGITSTGYNLVSWKYGYFEIEALFAKGYGNWPAFWMLAPNLWPPEFDVAEWGPFQGNQNAMHHAEMNMQSQWQSQQVNSQAPTEAFHKYGLLWEQNGLKWYVDNKLVFQTSANTQNLPTMNMYIILSNGFGSQIFTSSNPNLPNTFQIQYVKVWDSLPF